MKTYAYGDADTRNAQERIDEALATIESARAEQFRCRHEWGNTHYEPDSVPEAHYDHLEEHGSDPIPIYTYTNKIVDRWSRECLKCGKVEYTNKTKVVSVKTEPTFT